MGAKWHGAVELAVGERVVVTDGGPLHGQAGTVLATWRAPTGAVTFVRVRPDDPQAGEWWIVNGYVQRMGNG
jgi:hypothetical protein